jgi:hypothetical protein
VKSLHWGLGEGSAAGSAVLLTACRNQELLLLHLRSVLGRSFQRAVLLLLLKKLRRAAHCFREWARRAVWGLCVLRACGK